MSFRLYVNTHPELCKKPTTKTPAPSIANEDPAQSGRMGLAPDGSSSVPFRTSSASTAATEATTVVENAIADDSEPATPEGRNMSMSEYSITSSSEDETPDRLANLRLTESPSGSQVDPSDKYFPRPGASVASLSDAKYGRKTPKRNETVPMPMTTADTEHLNVPDSNRPLAIRHKPSSAYRGYGAYPDGIAARATTAP